MLFFFYFSFFNIKVGMHNFLKLFSYFLNCSFGLPSRLSSFAFFRNLFIKYLLFSIKVITHFLLNFFVIIFNCPFSSATLSPMNLFFFLLSFYLELQFDILENLTSFELVFLSLLISISVFLVLEKNILKLVASSVSDICSEFELLHYQHYLMNLVEVTEYYFSS